MISLLAVALFVIGLVLSAAGIPLKLCGDLLLSWWAVLCPVPLAITLSFILFLLSETKWARERGLGWDD